MFLKRQGVAPTELDCLAHVNYKHSAPKELKRVGCGLPRRDSVVNWSGKPLTREARE